MHSTYVTCYRNLHSVDFSLSSNFSQTDTNSGVMTDNFSKNGSYETLSRVQEGGEGWRWSARRAHSFTPG